MYISLHKAEKISLWRSPEADATLLATPEMKTIGRNDFLFLSAEKDVLELIWKGSHLIFLYPWTAR